MNGLFIFLAVVIISALIGAVSQMLKKQQTNQQARAAKARAAARSDKPANDIDRFLEEIDKLRRKNSGDTAPTVQATPVRKAKPVVARSIPEIAPRRIEELPVAPVVPSAAAKPAVARPAFAARRKGPTTPLANQLNALLTNKNGVQLAIILQEVLGPPSASNNLTFCAQSRGTRYDFLPGIEQEPTPYDCSRRYSLHDR